MAQEPRTTAAQKTACRIQSSRARNQGSVPSRTRITLILGIISTAASSGRRTSQFRIRLRKKIATSVQVSAEKRPSLGLM
jgi:hypothetical protein